MRQCSSLLAIAAISVPALAASPASYAIDLPAGPLPQSLRLLADQAALSIGTEGAIPPVRVPALKGRMTAEGALKRLLRGTDLSARQVGGNVWRLQADATVRQVRRDVPPPPSRASAQTQTGSDIVVTASKQGVPLSAYPGAMMKLDLTGRTATGDADASAALMSQVASLSSTNLGPGRNKLFIRGIADSSFNGPTPATVAQYYGDVRLNYSAPDPNLNLYDIAGVEVLEGPQGTLYGSAAIGGILRLVPNQPALEETTASGELGLLQTVAGDRGGDIAAMVNLPLGGAAAVRAVGYGIVNPGYIDDVGRGRDDVNRTSSYGGRIALRFAPAKGVNIELGGIIQDLESRDGQYAETGLPPLSRSSAIVQPFDSDFRLAYLTARAPLWGAALTSSTGFVRQELRTQFDATPLFGAPAAFVEDLGVSVLSHETRVAGGDPHGRHWVFGVSGLITSTSERRQIGPIGALAPLRGVRNAERELAVFGEATIPILKNVSATVGARVNYDEARGRVLGVRVPEESEPKRQNWRFLPKAAISWQPSPNLLVFAHYQEGFRPGGLSITGPTTAEKFQSDTVWTLEAGIRAGDPALDSFSGSAVLSRTRWQRIQSDQIDATGLPFISNIGDGTIDGIEAMGNWRMTQTLSLEAALFLNQATREDFGPTETRVERTLPNIAETGASSALRYRQTYGDFDVSAEMSLRYVGRSFLGVAPPLDLPQGRYALAAAEIGVGKGNGRLSLSVHNLFGVRANRFSYGNPFSVSSGKQVTPLRPRTIRIGLNGRF